MSDDTQNGLVDGKYTITDLFDITELRGLFDHFSKSSGFPIGFLDHPGMNILIKSGWQDICARFHRANHNSEAICINSNCHLISQQNSPSILLSEPCGHGLVDCAIPVYIKGKQIASLVTGQFFSHPPDINEFKKRSLLYGYDEKEYLKALENVPIIDEEKIKLMMAFFESLALIISQMGQAKLTALHDAEEMQSEILKHNLLEKEFIETLSVLESTLEATDNGILVVTEDGKVLHTNHRFAQMWHIPNELLKQHNDKITLAFVQEQLNNPQEFMQTVESLYASPEAEGFDVISFKDGRIFERASLPMLRNNKPAGRVWSFRDITQRKQVENELRNSEERLSLALQVGKAGVWEWNIKNNKVHFDSQFHAILGYEPGDLPDNLEEWTAYHHPADTPIMYGKVNAYLNGENPIYESEHRIRTKTGDWAWIFTRGQLVNLTSTGTKELFIGIAMNVTERKQVEEELAQYREHLEDLVAKRTIELIAMNEELASFSYSVSHDLRTPLRSLDGFSQVLLEDYYEKLDDEGKDYLKRIQSASQHMGKLIDDLLKLARTSRSDLHLEEVNISELVTSIVDTLRQSQPERQVDITIQDSIMAQADKRLLTIALENLLGNAWKFTSNKAESKIEFGTIKHNGMDALYLRDNGIGFDMNHADKLFTPFHRLHSEKDFPGSGIGLSTVQRIIQRHGGNIWAEAEVGKGATFYFKLNPG